MSDVEQGNAYFLSTGSHSSPAAGRCAMEWVAYIAGEEHSDSPACVSPVLREFGMSLNDRWDDEQRQKLRPYLARCIGTAGDGRDMERSWLATDWLLREFLPAFLDLVPSLQKHARQIRAAQRVHATAELSHCINLVEAARTDAHAARDAARDAAWDAAWDVARDAAGYAAWDAARDAAWDAAWDAAGYAARDAARDAAGYAAWDVARDVARDAAGDAAWYAAWDAARDAAGYAAGDAARDAAWDAAWDAAGYAARDALGPVVIQLQVSALDLFDRMLPTEAVSLDGLARDRAKEVCSV